MSIRFKITFSCRSAWSQGNVNRSKKAKPATKDAEDAVVVNGIDHEDDEDDAEEDLDESSVLGAENSQNDFIVDAKGLDTLQGEVVARTEGAALEHLQRLNCRLMECVAKYKDAFDRSLMVPELEGLVNAAFPPLSPNAHHRKKK